MLRRLLDRFEPLFKKGGKFEKLYPLYEAGDTFLYTPGEITDGASHVRDSLDLKRMMSLVVLALTPCIFMAFYNTGLQANLTMEAAGIESAGGWRGWVMDSIGYDAGSFFSCFVHGGLYFLPVYIVTMSVGGAWEVLFSIVRKHEVNEGFLVTGMLFPLTLPPTIPLWQVAVGISFGVVIGKEIFGGTGRNFLNPALTARAFLYFAHAKEMSGNSIWVAVDGVTRATPLNIVADGEKGGLAAMQEAYSWSDAFLGFMPGSMGETSTLACLIGAVLLIAFGIGSWKIMAGVWAGGMAFSQILTMAGGAEDSMMNLGPHWHLVLGGYAFGLVFMATDPVSASMTETGKWIYGALIGVLTVMVRTLNPAFPEGIMLAILFGNVMAPLIDYGVVHFNIKRRLERNA